MSLPHIICLVCDLALDRLTSEDGVSRLHPVWATLVDHDPLPGQAGPQWRGHCDFCIAPGAEFELPARDFRAPKTEAMSLGNWSCCGTCAVLIDTNRWNNVLVRVAAGHRRRYGQVLPRQTLAYVRALHRELRHNITGSIRPIAGVS